MPKILEVDDEEDQEWIAMRHGENGTESPIIINDPVNDDGNVAGTAVLTKINQEAGNRRNVNISLKGF